MFYRKTYRFYYLERKYNNIYYNLSKIIISKNDSKNRNILFHFIIFLLKKIVLYIIVVFYVIEKIYL